MNNLQLQYSFLSKINNKIYPKNKSFKIHIRIQQINSKKYITFIEDLPEHLDLKKLLKFMKKNFVCNGTIIKNNNKKIINLSGDQRIKVKDFLIKYNIIDKNNIIIHIF